MPKKKRVLILSDLHCGHKTGLLPPGQHRPHSDDKLDQVGIELWKQFVGIIEPLKPFDVVIANGDLIDGRENSGELIQGDRNFQADLATACLQETECKHFAIIKGTPFHVGKAEQFEGRVADNLNAKSFGAHEYIEINGLVFDCKHKVGSSAVPHGPYTPIAKERLWSVLWGDKGQPNSKVIIRSHTHKFNFCGDFDWLGMTTPGLQGTSEYGVTQVSRTIDWGVVYFDIWSKDQWNWKPVALELDIVKSEVVKF